MMNRFVPAAFALLLAGCQTVQPPAQEKLVALGTEPFWSVEVLPVALRYSTPENIAGTVIPAARRAEGSATIWTGTHGGAPFALRLAPGPCSDGMSDARYRYSANLTVAGQTLSGCAGKHADAPG